MCSMARAKIVDEGDHQVVHLPESLRFPEDQREVNVRREGRNIVLEPASVSVDEWPPEFLAILGAWDEEIERPPQRDISELKDPFE